MPAAAALAHRDGLGASPKTLPCRFFYDEQGSLLFESICDLPEYYLTRAEREILETSADEIASLFPSATSLVELGSGSSVKTRLLIEAFLRRHGRLRYLPVDISRTMLEESSLALLDDYPALEILAIAADYNDGLRQLRLEQGRPKLVLWLGSTIGNFEPDEARVFLRRVRGALGAADRLLVGFDRKKDPAVLEAAYDDAAGVTARFNMNLLVRVNRELAGEFDLDAFAHRAVWNAARGRVEMHLVSLREQTVHVGALDLDIAFAKGESIHTESSHKYAPEEIEALAADAGLATLRGWEDTADRFSLCLLGPQ